MTKDTLMLKSDKRSIIYGLVDPRSGSLRYIGSTSRGLIRPQEHWKRRQERERNDHCHAWIRSLLRENLIPDVFIIEETDHLEEAEQFWIACFKMIGADLTNMTIGGECLQQTPEIRLKISKTMKGRPSVLKGRIAKKRDPEVYRRIWQTRYEKYGKTGCDN